MFTGIIETLGQVTRLEKEDTNLHITLKSNITNELKIDQSLAHNGVCLTVVAIEGNEYTVTAIKETIDKSNIGDLKVNDLVNLERAMKLGARLDGHIVQGHVDTTGVCTDIVDENGSTVYTFNYTDNPEHITIEKGSITVNGVSLTVVNSQKTGFSVAIIPYTKSHTTFQSLKVGDRINLEFDVIGKYVARLTQL
ncbi:MAG: riboflavin synthase [Polaribacter sp.]